MGGNKKSGKVKKKKYGRMEAENETNSFRFKIQLRDHRVAGPLKQQAGGGFYDQSNSTVTIGPVTESFIRSLYKNFKGRLGPYTKL